MFPFTNINCAKEQQSVTVVLCTKIRAFIYERHTEKILKEIVVRKTMHPAGTQKLSEQSRIGHVWYNIGVLQWKQ